MAVEQRRFLVGTGLTSELGQALVGRLLPHWRILAVGRREVPMAGVEFQSADFAKPPESWLPSLVQRLGNSPVHGVVHAAGLAYSDHMENTTAAEWDATLAVNLTSAFYLCRAVSPHLDLGASVVMIGSVDAEHASQEGPSLAYGAAKAGLGGLVRHLAAEWGPRGVRVNGVALGALQSGMGPQTAAVGQSIAARTALGRLGRPDEAASAVFFLLSDDAGYITGTWLSVDGGLNITY